MQIRYTSTNPNDVMKTILRLFLFVIIGVCPTFSQFAVEVETNHSTVGFIVSIAGGISKVTGKFTESKITISWIDSSWQQSDFTKASINAVISSGSVNTGSPSRDQDLRDSVFFHAVKFPEITFKSKIIQKRDSGYVAIGDFSMKGVTKSIELPFTVRGKTSTEDGRPIWGFSSHTKLNRMEYGVGNSWVHSAIPNFIGNDVAIELDLWTRPPKKSK
jgi:polyisoprenoid-binding protein YceI